MDLCWIFKKLKLGHQEAQIGNEFSNLATMNPISHDAIEFYIANVSCKKAAISQ
jgi:hypothetical protein